MRLLTLNIRFGAGGERLDEPGYNIPTSKAKLAAITAAIHSVSPDVVALQEVANARQALRIADSLAMHHAYAAHPSGYALDFFEWGLATLYRWQRIRSASQSLFFDHRSRSGRLALLLDLKHQGKTFSVVNVHLEPHRLHAQAADLSALVSQTRPPVFLIGDFNCPAEDHALAPIGASLSDSCQPACGAGADEARLAGTLVTSGKRIDHIFFDRRYADVVSAGLVPAAHRRISDHVGYFADFTLK